MKRCAIALLFAASVLTRVAADPNHVRISIAVLDTQGRAVHGLLARDFQVREDGVLQTITSVDARHPAPRRIAILLDEFHVDAAYTTAVRDAVQRFVAASLRPDDAIVVLKPMDPLNRIALSTDRGNAERSIATFEGRQGNYEPRSLLEQETLGRAPALVEAGRSQVVLSALRALATQLGSRQGRGAILMVSEGFLPTKESYARGLPDVSMVERFSNRYDVPVFAIDPAKDVAGGPEGPYAGAVLDTLARATGGTVTRGDDIFAALAHAASDVDGGYTLNFDSTHGEDGKYHRIDVSVMRRRPAPYAVLARAGYMSPPSAEARRAARLEIDAPLLSLRPLHRSPWVDVWSGITGLDGDRERVAITWAPQSRVTVNGAAVPSTASRIVLQAKTRDGAVLFDGPLSPVKPGDILDVTTSNRAEFDAPVGTIELNMTIFGSAGQKLDVDMRDIDVPAITSAAPVLMPAMVVATWSAKEFNDVAADPKATPNPAHEFSRMQRLMIRVPAYAAGHPIPVTARLLNRLGQPMRTIQTVPSAESGVTEFDLSLAPLAPDVYYLLFSATHAGKTVEQRLDLRVTG